MKLTNTIKATPKSWTKENQLRVRVEGKNWMVDIFVKEENTSGSNVEDVKFNLTDEQIEYIMTQESYFSKNTPVTPNKLWNV